MALANSIAPHVPHLRRFARLITGTQRTGDARWRASCSRSPPIPACSPSCRQSWACTSAFSSPSPGVTATADLNPACSGQALPGHLAALTPEARLAFLLVSVEGFCPAGSRSNSRNVREAVSTASVGGGPRDRQQIATDVLIIEDEPLIALDLQRILEGLGHRIVSIARTRKDAIKAARRAQARPCHRRHTFGRRQLGPGRRGRHPAQLRRAGRIRYRISGTPIHRRRPRADFSHPQAVPRRIRQSNRQPSPVLRSAGSASLGPLTSANHRHSARTHRARNDRLRRRIRPEIVR